MGTLFDVFGMLMKAKSRIESDAEKEVDAGVDEAVAAVRKIESLVLVEPVNFGNSTGGGITTTWLAATATRGGC